MNPERDFAPWDTNPRLQTIELEYKYSDCVGGGNCWKLPARLAVTHERLYNLGLVNSFNLRFYANVNTMLLFLCVWQPRKSGILDHIYDTHINKVR